MALLAVVLFLLGEKDDSSWSVVVNADDDDDDDDDIFVTHVVGEACREGLRGRKGDDGDNDNDNGGSGGTVKANANHVGALRRVVKHVKIATRQRNRECCLVLG